MSDVAVQSAGGPFAIELRGEGIGEGTGFVIGLGVGAAGAGIEGAAGCPVKAAGVGS
ncbi:MAG: hypothetical protein U0361_08495 [Nitrospiraceae bacterium]